MRPREGVVGMRAGGAISELRGQAGAGGIQGLPMIASRRASIVLQPCLAAVDR